MYTLTCWFGQEYRVKSLAQASEAVLWLGHPDRAHYLSGAIIQDAVGHTLLAYPSQEDWECGWHPLKATAYGEPIDGNWDAFLASLDTPVEEVS